MPSVDCESPSEAHGLESELLAMAEGLRLLLKRDDVFWEPDASAARVLPALQALEAAVAAVAVIPERAAPVLGKLHELRVLVQRLYAHSATSKDAVQARGNFHATRAGALVAVSEFEHALTGYFDDLFARTRAP